MPTVRPITEAQAPDDIARLIRERRSQLDWSLAKLARAAGLKSPAYVFHIENGAKTPRESVARRIATALSLDPELLAAWARARGRSDLSSALAASERLRRWLGNDAPSTHVNDGPADVVAIPVLAEGADPESEAATPAEMLRLERTLLPPLGAGARLVAYRLSAHGARRAPESVRAGDCVVVEVGGDPPGPDAPCAARVGARIEIVRARDAGATHLPSPADAPDSRPSPHDRSPLVGRVVMAFRRWL